MIVSASVAAATAAASSDSSHLLETAEDAKDDVEEQQPQQQAEEEDDGPGDAGAAVAPPADDAMWVPRDILDEVDGQLVHFFKPKPPYIVNMPRCPFGQPIDHHDIDFSASSISRPWLDSKIWCCRTCKRLVSVAYDSRNLKPDFFLWLPHAPDGVFLLPPKALPSEATSASDSHFSRFILVVLFHEARLHNMEFQPPHRDYAHVKVCIREGKVVGFYYYRTRGWDVPALQVIWVRESARDQGVASEMLRDFEHTFRGRQVRVDLPNPIMRNVLAKNGWTLCSRVARALE